MAKVTSKELPQTTHMKLGRKVVYVRGTGFKVGVTGKEMAPTEFYRMIPKGWARQARKEARRLGYVSVASSPR